MTYQEAKETCEKFALKHKVIFNDEGECGFGRECVGFSSGDNWIDHNPYKPRKHILTDDERMVAATLIQWLGTNC